VDTIFELLSTCASLHPDPATASDDDEAFMDPSTEAQFEVFDGTAGEELSEVGRVRSDYINNARYAPY
jgi:nucleotide-sensitive chloride channel 1A